MPLTEPDVTILCKYNVFRDDHDRCRDLLSKYDYSQTKALLSFKGADYTPGSLLHCRK